MADTAQTGRLLYAVGVGLFGVALAAGVLQSFRFNRRLPAVDLLVNGSTRYIDHLRSLEDIDGAIEQLEMQSRLLPNDADTRKQLAKLLMQQGRLEEAQEQFQHFVRLMPGNAEGHLLLGLAYLDTHQPMKAIPCFTEAGRLNTRLPPAFIGLGVAWGQLGEWPRAEECFAQAIELSSNPGDAKARIEQIRKDLRAAQDASKKSGSP